MTTTETGAGADTPASLPPMPDCVHAKMPVKDEATGKYKCPDCGIEMQIVKLGDTEALQHAQSALEPTWWSKSIIRAVIRRVIGITADIKANEHFLRSVVNQLAMFGQLRRQDAAQFKRYGEALNDIGNEVIELKKKLQFYEGTDGLRRAAMKYREMHGNSRIRTGPQLVGGNGEPLIVGPDSTPMPAANETIDFQKEITGGSDNG